MTDKPTTTELLPCPLTVVENVEGTWDILVEGCLTHPRLTQWTKGSAEEAVRMIHEAYTEAFSRTPSPTPSSAEARAREIVRQWLDWKKLKPFKTFTFEDAYLVDPLINAIAALSAPQPTLAIEKVKKLLSDVLGNLHVINGETHLLVNFSSDPDLKPKERGLTIQEYRLSAHKKICEALAALESLDGTQGNGT